MMAQAVPKEPPIRNAPAQGIRARTLADQNGSENADADERVQEPALVLAWEGGRSTQRPSSPRAPGTDTKRAALLAAHVRLLSAS